MNSKQNNQLSFEFMKNISVIKIADIPVPHKPEPAQLMPEIKNVLTKREIAVCRMISDGAKTRQIAKKLKISIVTVIKHREKIRKKFNIADSSILLDRYLKIFFNRLPSELEI
jgi:DNA-binding NarL/FixJ family response regulator